MQVVATLVSHEPQEIDGRNGKFTLHKFKSQAGDQFQTSKTEIANAAYALLNQQSTITFDQVQRGRWTNNEISALVAGAAPGVTTEVPKTSSGGGGGRGGYSPKDQHVINRSAAIARAIELADFKVKVEGREGLFKLADIILAYIETPKTAAAPQGGAVSSDGGGGQAAAAPVAAAPSAPTAAPAAPAAAPEAPTDDIPF